MSAIGYIVDPPKCIDHQIMLHFGNEKGEIRFLILDCLYILKSRSGFSSKESLNYKCPENIKQQAYTVHIHCQARLEYPGTAWDPYYQKHVYSTVQESSLLCKRG